MIFTPPKNGQLVKFETHYGFTFTTRIGTYSHQEDSKHYFYDGSIHWANKEYWCHVTKWEPCKLKIKKANIFLTQKKLTS